MIKGYKVLVTKMNKLWGLMYNNGVRVKILY